MKPLKIAVNTGGGDAPGLNAVLHALTLAAHRRGWHVLGIHKRYAGLVDPRHLTSLTPERVADIVSLGGTILGTTNRGDPFHYPTPGGPIDVSDRVVENFRRLSLDVLVAIGGDGSLAIAHGLSEKGIPVVAVPKTIDNDLAATMLTFGFDTPVTTATEALDKLHSTASAHERVFVVEVMGCGAGWIALHGGLAASAHVILIPEIPFDVDRVCRAIAERDRAGKRCAIVVAAEGAIPGGGRPFERDRGASGAPARLGGIARWLEEEIAARTGRETRSLVLGHLQRGGSPTVMDRVLALRFGATAARLIAEGHRNVLSPRGRPTSCRFHSPRRWAA